MEIQSPGNSRLKEASIGLVWASVAFIIVMALLSGGRFVAGLGEFVVNIQVMAFMLLFFYAAPFISILIAPWLLSVPVLAGTALYLQNKYLPPRFTRYLVFAEVVAWQALGLWCADNVIGGWLSGR